MGIDKKKQLKEYRKQWYQKLDKENKNKYLTNVLNRYFLLQVKQMIIQLFQEYLCVFYDYFMIIYVIYVYL